MLIPSFMQNQAKLTLLAQNQGELQTWEGKNFTFSSKIFYLYGVCLAQLRLDHILLPGEPSPKVLTALKYYFIFIIDSNQIFIIDYNQNQAHI